MPPQTNIQETLLVNENINNGNNEPVGDVPSVVKQQENDETN